MVTVLYLIEILHQTTTRHHAGKERSALYLIEILHQTTTGRIRTCVDGGCILSKFYIKPQLVCDVKPWSSSCILSKFYIKPQLGNGKTKVRAVVSYRNSTSNHNIWLAKGTHQRVVSYRNSTSNHNCAWSASSLVAVVSYRNSTSNHNFTCDISTNSALYLIEILHQTTTVGDFRRFAAGLYLIEILHQTTTLIRSFLPLLSCILSKFYIKPQPRASY